MVPIRETCTCGRNSSPVANALSGFNQISFCHNMHRKTKNTMLKIFFIFKQTHFTAAKVDKRQNFPGYFFIWYNAIFGTAVWLESVSTWQHYFMLCQEMSIYYFTSTHLSFLFSPNLVITNSPCVLWLVSLLTPTKTASFLPTVRAGLAPNLQLFPPGLLVSESVVKHAD